MDQNTPAVSEPITDLLSLKFGFVYHEQMSPL